MEYNDNHRYSNEHPALTAAKTVLEVARCRFNHAMGKREVDAACYELSAAEQRLMQVIDEARHGDGTSELKKRLERESGAWKYLMPSA